MDLRWTFLVAFVLLINGSKAAVHQYKGQKFFGTADAFLFRGGREGLFASTPEAKAHWMTVGKGVANGKSYIKFKQLKFQRPEEEASRHGYSSTQTGLVQALMFEVGDRDRVGYITPSGLRYFCCSQELVQRLSCKLGEVIVTPHSGDNQVSCPPCQWPRVFPIDFIGNDTVAEATGSEIRIDKTGMYYLWYVICDKNLADVSVSGATIWKNPGGYLPGMMAPFLTFYGYMSLAYLVLGLLWFLQYARFWLEIIQLQNCVTVVIFLGMVEMATWYFDFVNFNATGFRPVGITIWAVLLGAVRKTVSRLLILVVSMGFGVVRPTLGGLTSKVLVLGGSYLGATLLLDVMQNVGAIDDMGSMSRIILVLPVAVLDAIFILWIFTSLSKTLALLTSKRAKDKLDLYRNFTNTLALSVIVSIAWIGYEISPLLSPNSQRRRSRSHHDRKIPHNLDDMDDEDAIRRVLASKKSSLDMDPIDPKKAKSGRAVSAGGGRPIASLSVGAPSRKSREGEVHVGLDDPWSKETTSLAEVNQDMSKRLSLMEKLCRQRDAENKHLAGELELLRRATGQLAIQSVLSPSHLSPNGPGQHSPNSHSHLSPTGQLSPPQQALLEEQLIALLQQAQPQQHGGGGGGHLSPPQQTQRQHPQAQAGGQLSPTQQQQGGGHLSPQQQRQQQQLLELQHLLQQQQGHLQQQHHQQQQQHLHQQLGGGGLNQNLDLSNLERSAFGSITFPPSASGGGAGGMYMKTERS
eukprot:jgi/Mesen1/4756/ME000242S03931